MHSSGPSELSELRPPRRWPWQLRLTRWRARRRYYFALVVKNQIVYLAMADKSISDIEAAHRFLKDISTKYASARCRC